MKKGLLLTLVMVAIALSGYRAMGRAPVVNEIRDIVVGDGVEATASNEFVYPDYINLNDIVRDPDGDDADIVWSFFEPTGKFIINGVQSQDSQDAQQIIQPLTEKRIAGTGVTALDTDGDSDGLNITITIRNQDLSPIGGAPYADPATTGVLPLESATITLFASDGSTVGMTAAGELPTFIAYTSNDEDDRTSPTDPGELCRSWTFPNTNSGWGTVNEFGTLGTVTHTVIANAVCLEVTNLGKNGGEWQSPYGADPYGVSLVANSVWRCRLTASASGNDEGTIPLWMFLFDNASSAAEMALGPPHIGANCFGGEFGIFDTDSSENSTGYERSDFEFWINPLAVQTDSWNNQANGPIADAGWDDYNDMRLRFRVFDLAGEIPGADGDHGQLCVEKVEVVRYALADMQRGEVVYEDTNIQTPAWRLITSGGSNATATNQTEGVRVAPVMNGSFGWRSGTVQLVPGDGSLGAYTDQDMADDYPIVWEDNALYLVEADMSCPNPSATENQGDVIRLGIDTPTSEFGYMNQIINGFNAAGTPKQAKDTFTAFMFGHKASLATAAPAFARLRPRFDILSLGAIGPANGSTDATQFHSVKVTKVSFY